MRRALAPILATLVLLAAAAHGAAQADSIGIDLQCLQAAYPGAAVASRGPDGATLSLPGGLNLPYDDGLAKNAEQALQNPSVKDMMEQPYPLGPDGREPGPDFDPGRRRVTAFFTALYGATKAEVLANACAFPAGTARPRRCAPWAGKSPPCSLRAPN